MQLPRIREQQNSVYFYFFFFYNSTVLFHQELDTYCIPLLLLRCYIPSGPWRPNTIGLQSLENGLFKYQEQLVVVEKQNLQTQLITKIYTQVSIAYFGKNKTHKIISNCYYQPRMVTDIDYYIWNCNNCCQSIIL